VTDKLQIRTIVDRLLAEGIRDALTIAVNLDAAGLIDGDRVTVKQVKQTLKFDLLDLVVWRVTPAARVFAPRCGLAATVFARA
jgi:hypothetical protein